MTFDPTSVEVTCVTLPKDHCVQVLWKYIKVCGYSDPFCKNLNQRSLTPRWPLTPHLVEVLCVTLPKDHCVQVPWKYIKVCGYSDLFCKKNLNQRSLTPRWPLTPHLLRSHVWLCPRIILSKSHENTSKYVDTVNLFAKTWNQRSLTPRWPLTPHLLRSHVWLCPRIIVSKSHGNTSMVCGYSYQFCKNYHIHTYTYILRTYYVHTTYILHTTYRNQWSHSLFLNYVQARQWSHSLFLNYVQARQKSALYQYNTVFDLFLQLTNILMVLNMIASRIKKCPGIFKKLGHIMGCLQQLKWKWK